MTLDELLDEAREKNELSSDYQLWHLIDAKAQELSKWRNGKTFPGPYHCSKLAEATGRTFEQVTAIIQIEKEKNEDRKHYWEKLAGTAASVILFTSIISATYPSPADASATNNPVKQSKITYILC